jgi:adenylate cyclase class 2
VYEVEAKGWLVVDSATALQRLAEADFKFRPVQDQHDTILARSLDDILSPQPGTCVARVRLADGLAILNVKTQAGNELVCKEHETRVEEATEAIAILLALGFHEAVQIRKRRWRGERGELTACIDEVDSLGAFVEIEQMYSTVPHRGAQEELYGFLDELLPGQYKRVAYGYDRLYLSQSKLDRTQ